MTKIRSFYKTRLRINEDYDFLDQFIVIVSVVTLPALKTALIPLKTSFSKYATVFKKITKSGETAEVTLADEQRDRIITGMYIYIRGMLTHFEAATADAARRIMIICDTFGNPSRMTLSAESSVINNLIQEFGKLENADYITRLSLEPWILQLEEAQRNFESIVALRDAENAAKNIETTAKAEREATQEEYLKFVEIYNAYLLVAPIPEMVDAAKKANQLIDRFANLVAQRQGIAAAKKEEE